MFEGDGHISISRPDAKYKNLSLSITFHLKDLPLAERLKDVTGFGWIRIKEKENACVLTFHTLNGLTYIVSLMNSYLRTPKLKKFNDLINILNKKKGLTIKRYPVLTQDFSKDAWLAGFIEADGSFGITNIKKKIDELGKTTNKRKVACRLRIQQRMIDPYTNESYKPLFNNIARFLRVNLLVVTRSTGKQYFSLEAKSRESLSIIKNYFNTYPLFSSKYHDFLDWETVVNLILCQKHYHNENSDLIEKLKSGMNKSRSNINWEHLDKLDSARARRGKKNRVLLCCCCVIFLPYKQKGKNFKACSNISTGVFNNTFHNNINSNFSSYLAGLFASTRIIHYPYSSGAILHQGFYSLIQKRTKTTKVKISTCTDLEIWGENLRSNVGSRRFTKIETIMIALPPLQLSVVVGLILSDGWLSYAGKYSNYARLGFLQSFDKSEYFWSVYLLLSHYCTSLPLFRYRKRKCNFNSSLCFHTRSLPCFTELYYLFYINNKKVIPENIYDLLTPIALAGHWVQGDGQVASNGLRLCTDSYQLSEVVKLMNVLMIKYRINCSLNILVGKPRIYISAKSMNLLSSIVKPYMSKDMIYKLESGKSNNVKINNTSLVDCTQTRTFSTVSKINQSILPKTTFGPYLAGLYEADGHIWIQREKGTKTHNPRFCITFALKNEALAKKLLEIIKSGFIRYKLKDNACVLVISPVIGLKNIVNLINGELKTPKIHQLYSLIDWLNKNHNTNIEKLPLNKDNLQDSSWFSGFVDGDGSFSVQYTKTEQGAKKRKISCRLRIEQRILDPVINLSYFDILNQISSFLNCKLLTRLQKSTDNTYYTLAASSKVSLNIIISYFNKYPLFSSKFLDYKDWERVAHLILNGQHLTDEGIQIVEYVRSRMNTKRTEFNWDHFKNLY